MTIEERRKAYLEQAKRDIKSKYRREREYADYVIRFLTSAGVVDGMTKRQRENLLPMPYNMYFG